MSKFWKKIIETYPDVIGRTIYFCPSVKSSSLPCIIGDDGTISPQCSPNLKFDTASKLADAWKRLEIEAGADCRMPSSIKSTKLTFAGDFFFQPKRKQIVRSYLEAMAKKKKLQNGIDQSNSRSEIDTRPKESETRNSESNRLNVQNSNSNADDIVATNVESDLGSSSNADVPVLDQPPFVRISKIMKFCPGFERGAYESTIRERQWDEARREFSPIIFDGDRCWAKKCEREIAHFRWLCYFCKMAKRSLRNQRWKHARRPIVDEKRVLHSADRWLTEEDRKKKSELLERSNSETAQRLRKAERRVMALEKELNQYRPKNQMDRGAVRGIVRKLNTEDDERATEPLCLWTTLATDDVCGREESTPNALRRHIRDAHINQYFGFGDLQCRWRGCERRDPFVTGRNLYKHLDKHIGVEQGVPLLREQLLNAARAPNGRRYAERTKRMVFDQQQEDGSSSKSSLPMPSWRSVNDWRKKNQSRNVVNESGSDDGEAVASTSA